MIAIKGMKMPKGCIGCRIGDSVLNCPCNGSTLLFDYQDKQHPDCPLVEIVTCKDCKYARQNEDNDRYCYLSGKYHDIDYYCAGGKRRE